MKAIICWLLGSEQCVWWYHYWAQHPNCAPCSVVGVLQPAGPEGPQCLLESLWRAHWHPPRTGAAGSAGGREKAAQTVEGEWGITGTREMHALASVLQFREFDKREDWFRTLWHLNMPTCACSEASFCLSVDAGSPGRGALSFAPSENRCGEEQILSCCGRVQSWAAARDQAGATRRQREDHQGTQGVCHTVERATAYVYLKMRWSEENGLSHWPPTPSPTRESAFSSPVSIQRWSVALQQGSESVCRVLGFLRWQGSSSSLWEEAAAHRRTVRETPSPGPSQGHIRSLSLGAQRAQSFHWQNLRDAHGWPRQVEGLWWQVLGISMDSSGLS